MSQIIETASDRSRLPRGVVGLCDGVRLHLDGQTAYLAKGARLFTLRRDRLLEVLALSPDSLATCKEAPIGTLFCAYSSARDAAASFAAGEVLAYGRDE